MARKGNVSGMTHVFNANQWRKIFFWVLIAVLAALTIKDVYALFAEYAEGEKEADMSMVFNTTMTLPSFTFCIPIPMVNTIYNSSKFKRKSDLGAKVPDAEAVKKLLASMKSRDAFLNKQWDRHMIHDAVKMIGSLYSLERETDDSFVAREIKLLKKQDKTDHRLHSINFWLRQINSRNVTFLEFMQKAGSEVLDRMIKKSDRISPLNDDVYPTEYKVTWISEGDICFQPVFSNESASDVTASGNFYNLLLNHDPENFDDDLNCILMDMNGRPANMERFIDSGGHTREGVSDGMCPGTTSDLIVEVHAIYQMLENDDKGTVCADFKEDEDSSEFNCWSRCRMNLIRSICGCSPLTIGELVDEDDLEKYPWCEYGQCNVDDQTAARSEKNCIKQCRRNCKLIRYKVNMVGTKESTLKNGSSEEPAPALHQTQINLAWGSFEYFQLEQNYKFSSIENFFAELGGAIGIWLGLSILSLIQGAGYIMELMAGRCGGNRGNREDGEDSAQEESRKFSANPLGPPTLSSNPLGEIAAPPRKRSTVTGPR